MKILRTLYYIILRLNNLYEWLFVSWEKEYIVEEEAKRYHERELARIQADKETDKDKRYHEREMAKIQAFKEIGLARANADDNMANNMRYLGDAINRNSCFVSILYFRVGNSAT